MNASNYDDAMSRLLREDSRYDAEAYDFLREALDFTIKQLDKPARGTLRHVTGGELLEGVRQYALQEFGPMALTVLHRWGVRRCEDFGEMVFNLVRVSIMSKTEEDRKEDFAGGYDFHAAFRRPFLPSGRTASRSGAS